MPSLQIVKDRVAKADAQQGAGGRMIRKVDTAAKVMMTKRVNPNQTWQVILDGDKSYSMEDEYRRGSVQDAVERALGFAVLVDDDGTVPAVFFGGNIVDKEISLDDFHDWVQRNRIRPDGGTPLTESLVRVAELTGNGDLFQAAPQTVTTAGGFMRKSHQEQRFVVPAPSVRKMDTPAFVIIVTDGAPNDRHSAKEAVQRLSYRGLFLKFLYVGHDPHGWQFLEELDDAIPVGVPFEQGGRLVDNVDAKKMGDLAGVPDNVFYEAMFDEVNTWLAAATQNGLI